MNEEKWLCESNHTGEEDESWQPRRQSRENRVNNMALPLSCGDMSLQPSFLKALSNIAKAGLEPAEQDLGSS